MPRSYLVGLIIRLAIGFVILAFLGFLLYRRLRPSPSPELAVSPTASPTSVAVITPTPTPMPTNLPHVQESPTPPAPQSPPDKPVPDGKGDNNRQNGKAPSKPAPPKQDEFSIDHVCCGGYIVRTYITVEVEDDDENYSSSEARLDDATWASAGPGFAQAHAGW